MIRVPIQAPKARDAPNTHPFTASDGIAEKKAPIVHPMPIPEQYPNDHPAPE